MLPRSSLPEQVFRHLAADVLGGAYAPGDRLPPQRELSAVLGVNMASVREGIKRLEQLKLVDVRHGDAMRVRDWRTHGGLDVLAHAALSPELTGDLFEARRLLLREAARMAAGRRADVRELAEAVAAAGDDVAAQLADLGFFAAVIDAAGNVVFALIMNSIRDVYVEHLHAFRAMVQDRRPLLGLYREAAAAMASGDGDAAAAAVDALAAAQAERMAAG